MHPDLAGRLQDLPPDVRFWIGQAVRSGEYVFGARAWESELAVCPVAAAAIEAGIWADGGIASGHPEWGGPEGPAPVISEFAAAFDVYATRYGIALAISVLARALGGQTHRHPTSLPEAPIPEGSLHG